MDAKLSPQRTSYSTVHGDTENAHCLYYICSDFWRHSLRFNPPDSRFNPPDSGGLEIFNERFIFRNIRRHTSVLCFSARLYHGKNKNAILFISGVYRLFGVTSLFLRIIWRISGVPIDVINVSDVARIPLSEHVLRTQIVLHDHEHDSLRRSAVRSLRSSSSRTWTRNREGKGIRVTS